MSMYTIINKTTAGINVGYIIVYKEQEYLADITIRTDKDYRTEFAIFKTKNQQIVFDETGWPSLPIYTEMDVRMDYESLEQCIDRAIEYIDNHTLKQQNNDQN